MAFHSATSLPGKCGRHEPNAFALSREPEASLLLYVVKSHNRVFSLSSLHPRAQHGHLTASSDSCRRPILGETMARTLASFLERVVRKCAQLSKASAHRPILLLSKAQLGNPNFWITTHWATGPHWAFDPDKATNANLTLEMM